MGRALANRSLWFAGVVPYLVILPDVSLSQSTGSKEAIRYRNSSFGPQRVSRYRVVLPPNEKALSYFKPQFWLANITSRDVQTVLKAKDVM